MANNFNDIGNGSERKKKIRPPKRQFDGDVLESIIRNLPGGKARMDALLPAIQQADEEQDHFWRLMFRYEYACEATFRDDPPKCMPAAAEFHAIYQEHPEALKRRSFTGAMDMHLMILEMGIEPIIGLPQIPMEQWQGLMDQFYALVKEYHLGLRTYWWQMCQFWQYIDKEKAFEYFQKFWKTGRDGVSDCRACERSNAVRICLLMGDQAAADEYARPIEDGRMANSCSDTPQKCWLNYLEDALDRGDLKQAEPRANALYRKGNRDKSDLDFIGAVLRCWSFTDLDRAVTLAVSRLEWSLGMWDQKLVYDFDKGAWTCFRQLAKRADTVELTLPEAFPLYREDGVYSPQALADWFYAQAEKIGRAFDARNGSDYFRKNLALAGRDLL